MKTKELEAIVSFESARNPDWNTPHEAYAELYILISAVDEMREALEQIANPHEAHVVTDIEIATAVLAKYPKDGEAPEETTNPYLLTGEELKRAEDKAKRGEK